MVQQLPLQQVQLPEFLQDTVASMVAFVPRLVGALLILLVGWIVGRVVAGVVMRIADGIELDRMVLETPLGRMLGGTESAVSHAFGTLAKWFVYAIAILAASNVLAIPELSALVATAVTYLPLLIAGIAVIVVGFVVADFIGDVIERTQAATDSGATKLFASGVRIFLYFTAIVIGLDTMGIDVGILYVFARALAWGLAAAVAIGVGVSFGLGGREYVSENIGDWAGRTPSLSQSDQQRGSGAGASPTDDD
ncbi:mechanosensitive ion channel family protein [Natronorubrum sp. DTA7]|uniref:mechanosensitive ion channel family protein n=1 Tax=Natronorubrum sp. DTA7 TaxID=3447016 RepID=UPI003F84C14C